ncbi:hypothetical protein TthWC1_1376 [Thermoanaerobacter thermohydrosulfuricus WC1]|uniref:Uncharacterized protein n=1 Tax=Thermoanaerobacter thermohydrosulfuricus WC1 TaxID=1198630 RepID=M8CXL3_THETY|nr:hypothetical protein TthWC1_1376 [Thermoanaerobacter thermohydrosulfuricus WC1]
MIFKKNRCWYKEKNFFKNEGGIFEKMLNI